jgi:alpha-tubulin suppressor-like RCC1 family protein
LTGAISVTAGTQDSCAVLVNRTMKCWGINSWGELGNNSQVGTFTPVTVSGLSGVNMASAGSYHTCAVLTAATVKCWGFNLSGELGNGTTVINSAVPVAVIGL